MSSVLTNMYNFFQSSKMEGSYFLLYALALVILYTVNENRNKWLAMYGLAVLVLIVANPLTIWLLSIVFPVVANYEQIVVLVPILLFVPFAITELISSLATRKERIAVACVMFFFVGIAGNLFGIFGGDTQTESNHYNDERKAVMEYVEGQLSDESLVLADDATLPFITTYGDNIPLLYGQDIMLFNGDLGIMDMYGEDAIAIHNNMWTPEETFDDVAGMAYRAGCDIIVVEYFDGAKIFAGPYKIGLKKGDYLVYVLK